MEDLQTGRNPLGDPMRRPIQMIAKPTIVEPSLQQSIFSRRASIVSSISDDLSILPYSQPSPDNSSQGASSTISKLNRASNMPSTVVSSAQGQLTRTGTKYIINPYINKYPICPIVRYDDVINDGIESEDKDVWISNCGMRVRELVPSLPEIYANATKRALYITGIPYGWTCREFSIVWETFGMVEATPCISDVHSQETFRWVIMSTVEEAQRAMEAMHHVPFDKDKLRVCWAIPPGKNISLVWLGWRPEMYGMTVEEVTQLRVQHGSIPPQSSRVLSSNGSRSIFTVTRSEKASEDEENTVTDAFQTLEIQDTTEENSTGSTEAAPSVVKTGSWADIAGIGAGDVKTINLHPELRATRPANAYGIVHACNVMDPYAESVVEQMRVVMILNIPNTITLDDVSNAVREGPVVSIRFGTNIDDRSRYVGVIFQNANNAETFYQIIIRERLEKRSNRFRFIPHVIRGEPFPLNDTIRSMVEPPYATRRLTIVKKGFFFDYGKKQMKDLCERHVGNENIQLVFLYNGGNATVLFADVESAMKIKKTLDKMSDTAGKPQGAPALYKGLQTTFSKDPCELGEVLKLQSSFPGGSSTY